MLRLEIRSADAQKTVLEVHGSIAGEDIPLLAEKIASQRREKPLILDLTGVRFIDQTGVALLREWAAERLEMRGESFFIRALLRQ